jgi:hypothetical protein
MEKPDCFGVWWEAIPGQVGDLCRGCAIKNECLAEFVTTLKAAQERLGAGATLSTLAEHLEVDQQAILLAMAYAQPPQRPKQTPVKTKKAKPPMKKTKKRKKTRGSRWAKERRRHPAIAQLTPGTKIEREFKDTVHTATVKKGGYDYGEESFPTLSALTRHIVGPGRDATKFWKLQVEG